jgi:hypothetical protein
MVLAHEPIGLDDIDTRVRWLLDLISGAETELLTRLWHTTTFDTLAAGRDSDRRTVTAGHCPSTDASRRRGWAGPRSIPTGCMRRHA